MYNEVIYLVDETKSVNEYGDITVVNTERMVYAELKSITQSEFYQAQATGLKPEIKFVLPDFLEYKGEKVAKYTAYGKEEPELYTVLRTYRNNFQLELVCKRGVDE